MLELIKMASFMSWSELILAIITSPLFFCFVIALITTTVIMRNIKLAPGEDPSKIDKDKEEDD